MFIASLLILKIFAEFVTQPHLMVGKKELNNLDPKIKKPDSGSGFFKNYSIGSNSLTNGAPTWAIIELPYLR